MFSWICQTPSHSAYGVSSFSSSWVTSSFSTLLWHCQILRLPPVWPLSLSLSLLQLTEIMQLMNAYFSAIHRQRGKGEDADITITERTEVAFHHLSSTQAPMLLELPSHPVWVVPISRWPPPPSYSWPAPPPSLWGPVPVLRTLLLLRWEMAQQPKQREGCFHSPSMKINLPSAF